jgi:YrbI family 3-deoxy-D-manno-octulosonate 8-phosphate phosphatase|tara:strand:- start:2690 stop:3205 length:516 start_codon:yes stop_codon:yes gene_type:complete
MNQKVRKRIKKIKLIATDVDGVLTDGGMYYSSKGDVLKKFHARDGMAVSILKKNTIPTVIITKERNQIVKKWSSKMNIDKLFDGVKNKEEVVSKLCKSYGLSENNIAYIGDDVNDLEILKKTGFAATPKDGNLEVKKIVDYICKNRGGEGVLREICDLIISIKFGKKRKLY